MELNYEKQQELGMAGLALLRNWLIGSEKTVLSIIKEVERVSVKRNFLSQKEVIRAQKHDVSSGYKAWAETYDFQKNLLIEVEEPVVKSILKKFKPGKVLDSACGTGRYSDYLHSLGHQVTGVDLSSAMLNQAKKRNSKITFIQSDINNLPFEKESFNLAICTLALTHFPDLVKVLGELSRVVQTGGNIVLSDINPWFVTIGGHAKFIDTYGKRNYIPNFIYWHSDYIKAFNRVGLTIQECYEPKIGQENMATAQINLDLSPKTVSAALKDLPIALIWVLKKLP